MKILISSDWQLHQDNIHQIKPLVKFIFEYCKKHKVTTIAHLGDLKHAYSPVDVRVYNYAVNIIREAIDLGIDWIQLLGNHDRSSMSDDAPAWFPVLRAAGARCISSAKTVSAGAVRLAMVPYMSDPTALHDAFKRLSKEAADLLFFHCSVIGCRTNVISKLKEGVGLEDLCSKQYRWAVGGHIHLPQELNSNSLFVGSPISMDWGESNQAKRFLVYSSDDHSIKSVRIPLPGMFDPSWPNFEKSLPKTWAGSKVRIHVPCDSSIPDVHSLLQKHIHQAEQDYKGAKVTAVPEYIDQETKKLQKIAVEDDEQLLSDYIDSTCPPYLSNNKKRIKAFLKFKLAEKGYIRRANQSVKFISADARNIGCYKKVKIDFKQKGIVVIVGKNKDWPKRDNGSGKTTYMSLPSVILQGRTLKGQANDKWVRRHSKGLAFGRLRLKLHDGRTCTVVRTRRPVGLRLLVNDVNRSIGIGVRGTQQAIEDLTGLTWEALKNAIYIDQVEVNQILSSKDAERKAIFSKLLNFERFENARNLLKDEIKQTSNLKASSEQAIDEINTKISELKQFTKDYDARKDLKTTTIKLTKAKREKGRYISLVSKYTRLKSKLQNKLVASQEELQTSMATARARMDTLLEVKGVYNKEQYEFNKIEDKCPTCKQDVPKAWCKHRKQIITKGLEHIHDKYKIAEKEYAALDRSIQIKKTKLIEVSSKVIQYKDKYESAASDVAHINSSLLQYKTQDKLRRKYIKKLKLEKSKCRHVTKLVEALDLDLSMLAYGLKVFSKDGLPAYLIREICPQLNLATTKYAKTIAEDEIKIKFIVDTDGAIDINIDNKHGGEALEDQSRGETRIASIVTSFAIREVISPCNVLFLDEPAEGLDSYNARTFAQVLKEIAKSFGCVFISTHNPIILAELAGEKKISIEKENGVAKVVN